MDAKPSSINEILYLPETYIIPVFQRYYEWEETNWKQLWTDIQALFDNRADALNHFIGPFVFISHSSPSSISHLIIDGQQRLITISLIFAALRDIALDAGLGPLCELLNQYLYFKDADGQLHMKMVTRALDRDTFKHVLNSDFSTIDKTSKIYKCHAFYKTKIQELLDAQETADPSFLKELSDTITRQLQLVEITLNPTDNPSNIYQSLNFKGKRLSDADLIRNYVFMKLPIDKQEDFDAQLWRKFEELFYNDNALNAEQIEDFYYRFLVFKRGYFPRKTLYAEFAKFLDASHPKMAAQAQDLEPTILILTEFAQYYLEISGLKSTDADIRRSLNRLKELSVDTALPFVLALYHRYFNTTAPQPINKPQLLSFLRNLESFVLRRSFLRYRTRGYGEDFAEAIKKSGTLDDLAAYFSSKGWPTDQEVRDTLRTFKIYIHESKKAKLILSEIEHSMGHKEPVATEGLTLEHFLPQALTAEWRAILGPQPEMVHERYAHTIGNLTLTGYNGELGNLSFLEKKAILKESNLSINKHFETLTSWDEARILSRTDWISKQFNRLWPRPK